MPFDPSKVRARLAPKTDWYRIENLVSGEVDVMLYGEIGWLGTTADDFVRDLKGLNASQINLHLSSPGGSVFDGIAIMNALRAHQADVTVYVDSLAASIASVIAMAGDRVVAMPASEFMIHEASGLCVGGASDLRELADLLDRQSDKIAGIYAERAGGTVEEWRAAMERETWYSAEEAVAAGLADEVAELPRKGADTRQEEAVAARAEWDLSVFQYAGREQAPAPVLAAKPETPKPAPPAPRAEGEPTLTIALADLLDEDTVARLRAAVQPPAAEPEAVVDPEPVAEPEVPAEPVATAEPTEPAEPGTQPDNADDWTAMVASLIPDDDDDTWSALVSNLIEPDASSSAATA
jgi:ATP-dependent Clp endopeptidase proteolytic subunit ClpP